MFNAQVLPLVAACLVFGASTLAAQPDRPHADTATVRLTPSAFPDLPAVVRRDLEKRGCRIPQVPLVPGKPHNVIQGAFLASGQQDWAILCSVADVSQILVYANGSGSVSHAIGRAEDSKFLQGMGAEGGVAFSRHIAVVDATQIRRHATPTSPTPPTLLDHVGIADAFVDKASTFLYFERGKWIQLQGAD